MSSTAIPVQSSAVQYINDKHQHRNYYHSLLHSLEEHAYHLAHSHPSRQSFFPRFDLEERDDTYELYGDLPGCQKEDIMIHAIDDQNIEIEGCTKANPLAAGKSSTLDLQTRHSQHPEEQLVDVNETTKWPHLAEPGAEAAIAPQLESGPVTIETPSAPATSQQVGHGVAGNTKFESGEKESQPKVRYVFQERLVGKFQRNIHFPKYVETSKVMGELHDGILYISIPKDKEKAMIERKPLEVQWSSAYSWGMY